VAQPPESFSERDFYLRDFRGRTMAIAAPEPGVVAACLAPVLGELASHGARVVVCATRREDLEKLVEGRWLEAGSPRLEAEAWRALRAHPLLGIEIARAAPFLPSVRDLALRLGVFKLVLLDPEGGIAGEDGARLSFVHLEELQGLLSGTEGAAARRKPLLAEIERMLAAGVPAVNVCSAEGLGDELFSYAGSGTLFTRDRYVRVRRLGIDDFDAAADLLARGVEEGFLLPRPPEETDLLLANGFGAFVEGRHLAGIGALLRHASGEGEIAGLYAITRFLGEGVGTHLVAFAAQRARSLGLAGLFACTTSERAAAFFARQGFGEVGPEAMPESKWRGYDPERRGRLRCFRREL
jgi:N-acetylglutamate synthase-like GNAT family acetyltransferase